MLNKIFPRRTKPHLYAAATTDGPDLPLSIEPAEHLVYHLGVDDQYDKNLLKIGDAVKIGQRLCLNPPAQDYCLSGRAGHITASTQLTGTFGRRLVAVTISAAEGAQDVDEHFRNACRAPSLEKAGRYFGGLPGKPDFLGLADPENQIERLVILGVDDDLLGSTNSYFVKRQAAELAGGITLLKEISGVTDCWLFVPDYLESSISVPSVTVRTVSARYPEANREMLKNRISRETKTSSIDNTTAFFSAEAVCALHAVCSQDAPFPDKILTFVGKNGERRLVSTLVGTPIRAILDHFGESLHEGDRLVTGGPMKGTAVFSADFPVCPTTDIIMVQDRRDIIETEDVACINCGACVRVCPAHIQVNMLIRLLEAQQYDEAASRYNLFSCIECGLCSYVCEARIAVYQHIKIAKAALNHW